MMWPVHDALHSSSGDKSLLLPGNYKVICGQQQRQIEMNGDLYGLGVDSNKFT